jgi:hypothetical protein
VQTNACWLAASWVIHLHLLAHSFTHTLTCWLAGETANGKFPDKAVRTMAAIVANAEVGINHYQVSVL